MNIILIVVMLGSCLGIGYILSKKLRDRILVLDELMEFAQRAFRNNEASRDFTINELKSGTKNNTKEAVKTTFDCIRRIYKNNGTSRAVKDELGAGYSTAFLTQKPYHIFFDEFLSILFTRGEIIKDDKLESRIDNLSKECQRSVEETRTNIKTNYLLAAAAGIVLIILIL